MVSGAVVQNFCLSYAILPLAPASLILEDPAAIRIIRYQTEEKHRVVKVLRISTILGFCIAVSSGVAAQTPCNPPDVIDSQITLGSIHDVTYCRQALVNDAFGTRDGNIPATLPVVTRNVRNPFWWVPNIAEVDNYHDPSSPPDATSEDALLYIAGPVSSGKVVILNGGHTGTCDWTQCLNLNRHSCILF